MVAHARLDVGYLPHCLNPITFLRAPEKTTDVGENIGKTVRHFLKYPTKSRYVPSLPSEIPPCIPVVANIQNTDPSHTFTKFSGMEGSLGMPVHFLDAHLKYQQHRANRAGS